MLSFIQGKGCILLFFEKAILSQFKRFFLSSRKFKKI